MPVPLATALLLHQTRLWIFRAAMPREYHQTSVIPSATMPSIILSNPLTFISPTYSMFLLCSVGLLCGFLPQSTASPNLAHAFKNITIEVPIGTTNHSDKRILCPPTRSYDLAIFFLANYVSHAATVKSEPGESLISGLVALVAALLLPTSGIIRGLGGILQCAVFSGSPLETASKARALSVVVRSRDWPPRARRSD